MFLSLNRINKHVFLTLFSSRRNIFFLTNNSTCGILLSEFQSF